MKFEFSLHIFEKYWNINFHKNPFGGALRTCRRTARETDGQTDMAKLIVAFRNFANGPKNGYWNWTRREDIFIYYLFNNALNISR